MVAIKPCGTVACNLIGKLVTSVTSRKGQYLLCILHRIHNLQETALALCTLYSTRTVHKNATYTLHMYNVPCTVCTLSELKTTQ